MASNVFEIINIVIVVIGFIVNYFLTQKTFSDGIKKDKISIATEHLKDISIEIMDLMDKTAKHTPESYNMILKNIYCYGSKDAINILKSLQQKLYAAEKDGKTVDTSDSLALYALLITQIKYDITTEIVSPESWFQIKITDYDKIQNATKTRINNLVEELGLNKGFKC